MFEHCRVQQFGKIALPCVVPEAEEAKAISRRFHPRMEGPNQWHVTR